MLLGRQPIDVASKVPSPALKHIQGRATDELPGWSQPGPPGQTIRPIIGEIVADAVWPAIIAPGHSERLRALLTDPSRRRDSAATVVATC